MMHEFGNLLDRNELLDIFRNFSNITDLCVSLRGLDGHDVLSCYDNSKACICSMMGNDGMCAKSIVFSVRKAYELGEPYIFTCGCGLIMSASAVTVDDRLIGAVLCGPAMLWDADDFALEELREKTSSTGLSEEQRRNAAQNTPKYSCEQMTCASKVLFRLVNYMCRSRNEQISQRRSITEQQATIADLVAEKKQQKMQVGISFYSSETEKELITAVKLGNRQKAKKLLNGILTDIFLSRGGDDTMMRAKIYELSGFLFRAASESGARGDRLVSIAKDASAILDNSTDFEMLCYTTTSIMERFIEAIYDVNPDISGRRYLEQAMQYISEHYTDPPSLTEMADRLGISGSYLSHLFSGGLHVTYTEVIAKTRVDEAKKLLANTDMRISEIAEKLGYSDSNYFIRSFKKAEGIAPNSYRKTL